MHGSIGILFEQAGLKGHMREVPGGVITFPFAIRNQFTVTLSTIEAGLDMRVRLLNMQKNFYQTALREADGSPVKGYVFSIGNDRTAGVSSSRTSSGTKLMYISAERPFRRTVIPTAPSDSYFVPAKQKEYRSAEKPV
ncbi:MAG: hypothetical protein MZV63_05610 [Marinilabiliales bacterium]|nr:hypothetical protein [Marinilabiliales bacterium]